MKRAQWVGAGLVAAWACMGSLAWGVDASDPLDKPVATVNHAATTSTDSQQMAGRIANELNTTCQCKSFSAASVSAQRAQTGWGWGEILIADRLAQAVSKQSNVSFGTALAEVTAARRDGRGWGEIAHSHGLNLGDLVSSMEKSANAVAAAGKNADKNTHGPNGSSTGGPGADHSSGSDNHGGGDKGGGGSGGGNGGGNGGGGGGGKGH